MADPVDACTWWFEGTWRACCVIHDQTSAGWLDFPSHLALGRCVAHTSGGPVMGFLMTAGIMLFGWVYAISQRVRRRRE